MTIEVLIHSADGKIQVVDKLASVKKSGTWIKIIKHNIAMGISQSAIGWVGNVGIDDARRNSDAVRDPVSGQRRVVATFYNQRGYKVGRLGVNEDMIEVLDGDPRPRRGRFY